MRNSAIQDGATTLGRCHDALSPTAGQDVLETSLRRDHTIRCNGLGDVFVKIARITDAGCASVTDQTKALLVEIFVQATATLQGRAQKVVRISLAPNSALRLVKDALHILSNKH